MFTKQDMYLKHQIYYGTINPSKGVISDSLRSNNRQKST